MSAAFTQSFWDERYRSSNRIWSGNPNPQLVAHATELTPGSALDVGCGEGADAIWLATRGWRVTALDVSTVALERAAGHARDAGEDVADRITWLQADLLDWDPPVDQFDLVSAQFMQLPGVHRVPLHRQLAAAVRPGGSLLIVGHHPSDMHTSVRRPKNADLFFTAEDVAGGLEAGEWDIVVAAAAERQAPDPDGQLVTVRDAVVHALRRAAP
jgi:SAM-dependent methyltransferase